MTHRPSRHRRNPSILSRRHALQGAGGLGLATILGARNSNAAATTLVQSTPTTDISGTSLRILQWQHFVPAFDDWFETFLAEWGEANGVDARVDRVSAVDLPSAISAEIGAQSGHDMVEYVAPLPQFEPNVLDLRDVVNEAERRHGPLLDMAHRNIFNPHTGKTYGYCHGFAPDPALYRKSIWETVDMPDGPATLDALLDGGTAIFNEQGVQMGIGMSAEADSNVVAQAIIWAFGGAVQDESENIVINSPETIAAVEYVKTLYESCMTPEVFGWNPASNNQLLVAGRASYIYNSISAYRTAQEQQPDTARDIFLSTPLEGPAGPDRALALSHAVFIDMIPTHAENPATAMEFLLHLTANYEAASRASKLYNLPAFPDTFPALGQKGGPFEEDPYGSEPPDKLLPLRGANDWTVNLGWPGPANAMIGECLNTFVLSDMFAHAARGDLTPEEAVADAETRLVDIAQRWRDDGLMSGDH